MPYNPDRREDQNDEIADSRSSSDCDCILLALSELWAVAGNSLLLRNATAALTRIKKRLAVPALRDEDHRDTPVP